MRLNRRNVPDDDANSFEPIKRRAKRNETKITKATESLVTSLQEQNDHLSSQLLLITKLYRACYRLLPDSSKASIQELARETESLSNLEVHP